MKVIKKYWPLLLVFIAVLAIYFPVFSLYFTQDDFFHLKMGTASSVSDFLNFFSFRNPYGYPFYRPLATQVYYFLMKSLFSLQPLYFHLTSFLFFLGNIFLVYGIGEKLLKKRHFGFLMSFLYALNASNLGSLAYISNFQEIGMAFFLFLSFWLYLENKKIAPLFFVFSLLSKENAMVFPLLLIVYEFLLGKKKWKKTLFYWFILGFYVVFRLGGGLLASPLGGPDVSVYQPIFELRTLINSYFWYLLWGIGLPEMLIDFVGPGLKIDPRLIIYYRREVQIIFSASLVFVLLLAGSILRSPKKEKKKEAFFLLWFLIGLLPVIFWPWHKFSYYLTLPLLGLIGFFVLLLKNLPKILIGVAVLLLLTISLTTIHLSWRTYWVITRAKIAQNLIHDLKEKYPELPRGATLYFENDPDYPLILGFGNSSTQAYYTLSGENGPQVIYDDYSLRVYYQDLEKPPEGGEVYSITAKIKQE
jgi:hypothetical protein